MDSHTEPWHTQFKTHCWQNVCLHLPEVPTENFREIQSLVCYMNQNALRLYHICFCRSAPVYLQIQSVYCVNYAKNILSGNELFSTFSLRLPLCATSLVLVFLSLLGSNQYFIYFSMLKNLWAMLHIYKIYSYSCVHYRLLWIFPHMKVAHVAFLPHRAPPDSFLVCVHLFALLFRFAYILIFSSRINLLFCFICRKKRKRANIE